MRNIIPALLLAFCSFIVLISVLPNQQTSRPSEKTSPQRELYDKQTILQSDLERTRQLHRLQCRKLMQQVLNDNDESIMIDALQQLQDEHPHILQLTWVQRSQSLEDAITIGEIPQHLQKKARTIQNDTLHILRKQQYENIAQSQAISDGKKEEYFVIGVSRNKEGPFILGFMHQHMMKQLHDEQRKNLRIVPYPSDKRYKIKAAEADTLRPVKVRKPEDNEGVSHYHVQQVVVKFKHGLSEQNLAQIQNDIQANHMHKMGYTYVFQSEAMTAEQMMTYFEQQWDIVYAEPHFIYMTNEAETFVPNDVLYRQYQWNLPMIGTSAGWNLANGHNGVVVAVIDTGIDLDHVDLAGRLVDGLNVIDGNKLPYDDVGHGTHVAGVISAVINNVEGVAGMSWADQVMPIKALDHTGAGSTYAVAQGIIWATDHGAKVINMSLGNYVASEFLHDAIKYAYDRDVVLVSASGNDDTEDPGYPAAYPEVLAVSATNASQRIATFSNYGYYIDVAAPGEHIASTYPDNEYAAMSGTSMASPHVAALAAMIRAAAPNLTNQEVMDIIRHSATDLGTPGHDHFYGYGQIDVARALQLTRDPSMLAQTSEGRPSFIEQLIDGIWRLFKL